MNGKTVRCAIGAVVAVAAASCSSESAERVGQGAGVAEVSLPENRSLKGPFTDGNLAFALILGSHAEEDTEYLTLGEALASGGSMVWERGGAEGRDDAQVWALEIENNAGIPLYVQAGDIVNGGKQDRTIVADLVIPAHSGRLAVGSFCVEQGRWTGSLSFRGSPMSAFTPELKRAIQGGDQQEVWREVANANQSLDVRSSSGALLDALTQRAQDTEQCIRALEGIISEEPQALGFVVAVNGEPVAAELYGDPALFRKMWPKLLPSYALYALAQRPDIGDPTRWTGTLDACRRFLSLPTTLERGEDITEDVRLEVRRGQGIEGFHYFLDGRLLHANLNAVR